ncbi:MAG: hypothetical protein B7X04_02745 [Parcubacteria group bacterium 21-54-25]|nr:MAG: hypothetical protein B7X04_02745 [Parcubacteria group bacterium 21-54-25]HQU07728.1 YebC/PmpR family DNA-binding transcriptional regulator [Candidatus Paceibacterota bacterium]
MSGHSKWSQIKRQKGSTDAAKSRVFARFSRLIALESKQAGGNVSAPALKTAVDRAKAANMPKDSIERAIAKGVSRDADSFERVIYECYGPAGTAVVIDVLTDNRNRTTQEVKHLLSKQGYELSTPGSAAWAFTRELDGTYTPNDQTLLVVSAGDEEKLSTLLTMLDENDDVQVVYTNAREYESTRD